MANLTVLVNDIPPILAKNGAHSHTKHPQHRRHLPYDREASATRAITSGESFLEGKFSTIVRAAYCCGSNAAYVRDAITLLRSEDRALLNRVLAGEVPLEEAAKQVRKLAKVVSGFRAMSPSERALLGRTLGIATVWDELIVPAL
jgi:hypothetical protein